MAKPITMKIKSLIIIFLCTLIPWSCSDEEIVKTEIIKGGFDIHNIDNSVSPGDDFYQYAVGGWMKEHPGEGIGTVVANDMIEWYERNFKSIINGEAKQTETTLEIKQVYELYADRQRRKDTGTAPLLACMKRVNDATDVSELIDVATELIKEGHQSPFSISYTYGNDPITGKAQYVIFIDKGFMEPYLPESMIEENRDAYIQYIRQMLKLTGFNGIDENEFVNDILKTDKEFYDCGKDVTASFRLKDIIAVDNKEAFRMFRELNIGQDYNMIADNTEYVKVILQLLTDGTKLEQAKHSLIWALIVEGRFALTEEMLDATDRFEANAYQLDVLGLDGQCYEIVRGLYETELGKLYAEQNVSEETREMMKDMVGNIRTVFREHILNAVWLDEVTRAKAVEKLDAIKVYAAGTLTRSVKTLPDNCYDSHLEWQKKELEKMYQLYGSKDSLGDINLYEYSINALYCKLTNSVNILAGYLQFNSPTDIAYNYGTIGYTLAHELTHSLDSNCRYFDKDGNYNDWWSASASANYDARARKVSDYYSTLTYGNDYRVDGEATLGETVADLGGIKFAYEAMMREAGGKEILDENGLTLAQRFFLAFAFTFTGDFIPETFLTDSHVYAPLRINSVLANTDAWYKAFDIRSGDKWYIAPEERVGVW